MVEIFDIYEIRARLIPSVIVLSPLALPVAGVLLKTDGTFFSSSLITVCLVALVYGFSLVVRTLGKKIEDELWESSGGAPSSKVLLDDDSMFASSTKTKIKEALKDQFDIDLDNLKDVDEFSRQSHEAFRLVRQRIRQSDPEGLWLKHDAEYGFLRNLLGSSKIWMVNAAVSTVLCAAAFISLLEIHLGLFTAISAALCVIVWFARKKILPSLTESAANQYAESAWLCFLDTAANDE